MRKTVLLSVLLGALLFAPVHAADYIIDSAKAHASINFRIQHFGFSWMHGRFNKFEGSFSYDPENLQAAKVDVTIDVASIDTNYEMRDNHLRSSDFFNVAVYPKAHFVGKSLTAQADGNYILTGEFTLQGVTNPLTMTIEKIGEGESPWGGYRAGFEGHTQFTIADYGMDVTRLGPSAKEVYLTLSVEGIRQ